MEPRLQNKKRKKSFLIAVQNCKLFRNQSEIELRHKRLKYKHTNSYNKTN